jgi:DNA polymerase-3 subunit delta
LSAHLIYGDSFLVPRRLTELVSELGADDVLDANRHRLVGPQVKPGELLGVCNALPFMDAYRLVIVEGLLTTAETKAGRGRPARREPASESKAGSEWQVLAEAVPNMPDTTVLVLIDGPLSANNSLLRMLRPVCQPEELSAPSGEALARWIKDSAQAKGSAISPSAIRSITDLVGNDLWTLDQELEKLSLYASGREIEEADIQKMVSQVREASIFAAVDAMIDGRPAAALRLLHQLREDGREAPYIIGMVERQLRMLALARDSMDKGVPRNEIGGRLGTSSDFVVRKTLEQAQRHSWQDIVQRYNRLLEADLAIKQGQMEPELALELMVGEQASAR